MAMRPIRWPHSNLNPMTQIIIGQYSDEAALMLPKTQAAIREWFAAGLDNLELVGKPVRKSRTQNNNPKRSI